MSAGGRQVLGLFLAIIGFIGSIVICILSTWKVSVSTGSNIITSQNFQQGLWMSCVIQSTGQMQCKVYDSMLELPRELQISRALVIISIIFGFLGVMLGVVGGSCTNIVPDEKMKSKAAVASGVLFITAGVLVLIPVSWIAGNIICNFMDPLVHEAQKTEMGSSLFIGWVSAALLFLGGGLLCCFCPSKYETGVQVRYSA